MESELTRIKKLAEETDGPARQRLMSALHKLAYSMETPDDTLHRYGAMNLQTATIKIGFDLRLFKYMVECSCPLTVDDLSKNTSANALLTSRIMKYLSAIGVVDELGSDTYCPNNLTQSLSEEVTEAGVNHYFATVAPVYQALPAFLKRTGYENPTDETHTAFQDGWKTPLHAFPWFSDHPENLAYFNNFMAFRRESTLSWLTVYPVENEAKDWDSKKPVYVNVGGGIGHQCAQFKDRYPDIPGDVILQDMPHSISHALPTPGVKNMACDFFQPQPIKGAKFYFMRGVFHNHPTHKVRLLLENTKSAMTRDSILLIDEMILPATEAHVSPVSMDLTMLAAFAGMERTEAQWRDVINEVGLRLVNIYVYNPTSHESVMDVRLV